MYIKYKYHRVNLARAMSYGKVTDTIVSVTFPIEHEKEMGFSAVPSNVLFIQGDENNTADDIIKTLDKVTKPVDVIKPKEDRTLPI